jgi:hypothetical protein
MIRKKQFSVTAVTLAAVLLLLTLSGCGKSAVATDMPAPAANNEPAGVSRPVEPSEPGMQNGERYEGVIILEGMEEAVQYEHIRNVVLGFEMDYDYEILERRQDADRELFLALGEDPEDPWNYFEIRRTAGDADSVSAGLRADFSDAYETVSAAPFTFDGAGACTCINVSGAKDGKAPAGSLLTVYVIPADGSCLVALVRCTFESAGGFGVRANAMLNTLTLIG